MRKTLMALFVLLAMLLAACGGGEETPQATEEPQAGGETTEQTGGSEATTVEDPWGVVDLAPGEPVKIGFAAGLSGDVANLGIDMQNAAQLAVEDKPEIKGHKVELVVEDSQCSGEGGTAVAQKFAADGKILGVVGHMCSSASIPASDIYEQAHIVMISPSSTAVALTNRGLETVNRVAWNDAVQGSAAAEYLYNELGVKKVAVIHDGSAYGQGLADVFKETFESLGGEVTDYEGITVGEKDFRATLTKIAANAPEAIYFGGFQAEAALLVSQKSEVGLEEAIFFTDDGAFSDQYIEAAGGAAEGSYATFADLPAGSPELEAFRARYKEKYGVEPSELGPFHAHAYDATMVLLNAIEKVAVEREDGTLLIPRKALAEAVRATKNYKGLSGTITCDEKGDCGSANIIIYQVQNGEWVRVFPPEGESMGGEEGGEATVDVSNDPWGVVELAPGEAVKIGFAAGLSGDVANLGIDMQNAAQLAVEDKPEIKGHKVELVVEDSQCSGEGGTAVAQKFAADGKILGVVGHMCSSASIPASDIYEQAHIVMISPSSTAVALTNRGLETVNRVAWNDAVQGAAAAEYLYNELGVRKVAVIHDGSAYGQGLADVFKETFESLGGEVTDYEGITVGEKDFRATLTKISAHQPEAIYFGGFQAEAALLVSQKNEVGLESAIFFTDDGAFSDQYIEASGGAAEGSYATFADLPAGSPELEAFRARYKEKYGVEPSELGPFHAHAYDATMVLLNAIEQVAVDQDGTLLIPRKALAEAVRATKNYKGLSGTITCDEKGDCGSANIIIYQVQNGEWVRVFPPES